MVNKKNCIILIPTFNDWISLNKLLSEIQNHIKKEKRNFEIYIVNDASTEINKSNFSKFKKFKKIKIIDLKENSGSQIAIAVGLNKINKIKKQSDIIILDSDGEDNPYKIKTLLNELKNNAEKIIVASRSKRRENILLRILNALRLFVTYILTGYYINFGNFSCFSKKLLPKIYNKRELSLSFSGTAQKYLDIKKIPIEKQKRYFGKSKVSLKFLITYSIQIISIFKINVLKRSAIIFFFIWLFNYLNFLTVILLFLLLNFIIFKINNGAKRINFLHLIKNI